MWPKLWTVEGSKIVNIPVDKELGFGDGEL